MRKFMVSVIQRPRQWPWNPLVRGSSQIVDAGDPWSPSFRGRSPCNPLWRGTAVRCRYFGGTIWGIPARSARMTAGLRRRWSLPRWNQQGGIASSQSTLDSASSLRRKPRSLPCSSFSAAIRFAGFAAEAEGIVATLSLNDGNNRCLSAPYRGFFACLCRL